MLYLQNICIKFTYLEEITSIKRHALCAASESQPDLLSSCHLANVRSSYNEIRLPGKWSEFWDSRRWWFKSRSPGFVTPCSVVLRYQRIRCPWRWRQHGSSKRWSPNTTLHGVTTQKT